MRDAVGDVCSPSCWPNGLSRVPYAAFQEESLYRLEQERLFRGPTWSFLCLSCELPDPGDFRTTHVGETPVIVTRSQDGEIFAFENKCSHRGALIALDRCGKGKTGFSCVYHSWSYDMRGDLVAVAFRKGVKGSGGMPPSFKMEDHHPRKLRVAEFSGLIFGTFSKETLDIKTYLGDEIAGRIERVFAGRTARVIGRYTQSLPNNWKLYFENVKDSYHASILHLFFTTFEINRLSQTGGIIVDDSGGHHVSFARSQDAASDSEYSKQKLRSKSNFRLADPSLLESFREYADGITLQILSIFPGFVLQQIQNSIAVRQILPRSLHATDLNWTLLGFDGDTPEQLQMRLKQANLVGPAGYISMEDGCVGGFVQRGIAGASNHASVIEMGGHAAESSDSRVTEASVRGFWKLYRKLMQL